MDALKSSDLGFPNRCSFKYMLATSSCLYAGFRCELQLAVSNCSRYMLDLGEQARSQSPRTSKTSSEHPILYIQKW